MRCTIAMQMTPPVLDVMCTPAKQRHNHIIRQERLVVTSAFCCVVTPTLCISSGERFGNGKDIVDGLLGI